MKAFNRILLVSAATALTASGVAQAASDGLLDGDSTGTSDVSIIKTATVQVSGLADIDLGTQGSLSADAVESDGVCVFSSSAAYQVTLSGGGVGFELDDGSGNTIPYAVTWAANGGAAASVTSGTAITGLVGNATDVTCASSDNATFEITVAQGDFNGAAAGTYSDTLTMLVEPE